jgi:transposase
MSRRARRSFTAEYKAEVVALVRKAEKPIGLIARDLDLSEGSVRSWLKEAEGVTTSGPLELDERAELTRLRDENRVLRMERDFLKNIRAPRRRTCSTRNSYHATGTGQAEWPSTFWCSANP